MQNVDVDFKLSFKYIYSKFHTHFQLIILTEEGAGMNVGIYARALI